MSGRGVRTESVVAERAARESADADAVGDRDDAAEAIAPAARRPTGLEVGNDVVDLLDPDTRPGRPRDRFDARVFGDVERRAIAGAREPAVMRWSLWAAKEAGYKLLRKRVSDTVFSPVRFETLLAAEPPGGSGTNESTRLGQVRHGSWTMDLVVRRSGGAVHAVATWPDAGGAEVVVEQQRLPGEVPGADEPTPAELSRAVRALAIDHLALRLDATPDRLRIVKRDRIPELWIDDAPSAADLSLSHHGHVVAFACRMPRVDRLQRRAS